MSRKLKKDSRTSTTGNPISCGCVLMNAAFSRASEFSGLTASRVCLTLSVAVMLLRCSAGPEIERTQETRRTFHHSL